jgi:hypothetical protein
MWTQNTQTDDIPHFISMGYELPQSRGYLPKAKNNAATKPRGSKEYQGREERT